MANNKTFNYARNDIAITLPYIDTINDIVIDIDSLKQWLSFNRNIIDYYSLVYHCNDSVYLHYHLLIHFNKKIDCSSLINNIARFFGINLNMIDCKPCTNFRSYSRYLIHLDNPDKFQYSIDNVLTSDFNLYCEIINSNEDCYVTFEDFNVNKLIEICLTCKSIIEVYSIIGLEKAQKYRFIINDIFKNRSALKNKGGD